MRRLHWLLVLVVIGAGCTMLPSQPPATPEPPSSGPGFDDAQWEEPSAPLADHITAQATSEWSLHVTGRPGTVAGGSQLVVADLGAGRGTTLHANADGSFATDIIGGPGAIVQIGLLPDQLPPEAALHGRLSALQHLRPSTYVHVPPDPIRVPPGSRPAYTTSRFILGPAWRFGGTVTDTGSDVHVTGVLRIQSSQDRADAQVTARLVRYFNADGEPLPAGGMFATAFQTPSGFALERLTKQTNPTASPMTPCPPVRETPATIRCDVDIHLSGADIPAGGYAIHLWAQVQMLPSDPHGEEDLPLDALLTGARQYDASQFGAGGAMSPQSVEGMPLAFLVRGLDRPPRLASLLMVDAPAQATRGVQAIGDRWGWANHIASQPALHVTPRTDATGQPIRYTLEPYLPQIMVNDRETPSPPPIDLQLPGGTLTVTVRDPAGESTVLGPAPFTQLVTRTASTRDPLPIDNGGDHVDAVARLAGADSRFRHAFQRDGLHTITVDGTVQSRDGDTLRIRGTYPVMVAEPMDLDPGMLPGTPLAVGDYVDRAIQMHPPVPAEITYRFREWTGPEAMLGLDVTTTGRASRFGWFHPHPGQPIRPNQAGEYRIDIQANYTDATGRLWAAGWSFGGVVVDPATAIELHGRRGDDTMHQGMERFRRSEIGVPAGPSHLNYPYRSGDVAWQTDDDAMNVVVTAADPDGSLAPLFNERSAKVTNLEGVGSMGTEGMGPGEGAATVATRFSQGKGPLFSTTATGRDPSFGDPLQRIAYYYGAVEKPGVRVRETWREDHIHRAYWRFIGDTYGLQPGMSMEGDEPNDYKFLFGGAIVRDASRSLLRTGAYASFWVDVAANGAGDSRIASPFDPTAPPLFANQTHPVRAFYDPTGTRPGSLLVEGDIADFGGYLVPLGPQQIQVKVTSPSGKTRDFRGQANPWGHLHDPKMNFEVDEAGVWLVEVRLHACPPQADSAWNCLDGGLNDGETRYEFYVASRDQPAIEVSLPAFLQPRAELRLSVTGVAAGAHQTTWMPGWLLDDRDVGAGQPLVVYKPSEIAKRFPNFESHGFSGRPGPMDQVTFTALAPLDGAWRGLAFDAWGLRVMPGGR